MQYDVDQTSPDERDMSDIRDYIKTRIPSREGIHIVIIKV